MATRTTGIHSWLMRAFLPGAAVLVSGLALYFTRSVLDVLIVEGRPVRVALLASWPVLAAFVAMAALAVSWLARRSMPRTVTSAPVRLRVGALTLPLLALAILIVPFVPVLPDIVRPLLIAAGPIKWVILLAVGGLFVWTLWQGRIIHADWLARLTVVQAAALVGLATALVIRGASGFASLDGRDYTTLVAAAVSAALMWKYCVDTTNAPGASTFGWAAITLTVPFLWSARVERQMVASVVLVTAVAYLPDGPALMSRLTRWLAIAAPTAVIAWLSVADAQNAVAAGNLIVAAPAWLFDQQYGLLAYAPVYILAATGLTLMFRSGDALRRRAIEIAAIAIAVLGSASMLPMGELATTAPARPLACVCFLFALPIAYAVRAAAPGSVRRASHLLLLLISVGIALTQGIASDRFVGSFEAEGASRLLEYWSSAWPVWTTAPAFTVGPLSSAWIRSGVWLAAATVAALAVSRWRTKTAGGATLAALGALTAALLVVSAIAPQFETLHRVPVDLNSRARLSVLDEFDQEARPLAIKYNPFEFLPPRAVVPLATLGVGPGVRADAQPIRVLHNGGFSLPAGQYHIDVEWADDMDGLVPLALQIGLSEPAWRTWPVKPERGRHWVADITLPIDAAFIALRGGTDLERAIGRVAIQPVAIVDAGARPQLPSIRTASQLGSAMVIFHDDSASQESRGFWVLGGQTARVSFVRRASDGPLTLRVHSGLKPNRVVVSSRGWEETLLLRPQLPEEITLPDSERRVVTVDVRARDGFHPRDYDPASPDPRFLGAWVEIAPLKR